MCYDSSTGCASVVSCATANSEYIVSKTTTVNVCIYVCVCVELHGAEMKAQVLTSECVAWCLCTWGARILEPYVLSFGQELRTLSDMLNNYLEGAVEWGNESPTFVWDTCF